MSNRDDLTPRLAAFSLAKRALFEREIRKKAAKAQPPSGIQSRANHKDAPLSFAQQRLWFLDQLEPDSLAFIEPTAVRIQGPLDINALRQALNHVLERHEVLRTTFVSVNGSPAQHVSDRCSVDLSVIDLKPASENSRNVDADLLINQMARRRFDLGRDQLLRASLIRLGQQDHILLLVTHHVASDGWSAGILFRELSELYHGLSSGEQSALPSLSIQYADYAVWQREWLQGEELERQLGYWRKQLTGVPTLELPTDLPRSAQQTFAAAKYSFNLSSQLGARFQEFNRLENTTPFMTLLSAFQVLLCRYSAQNDIVIGTPIANRQRTELENLIGLFANTLVLRGDLHGEPGLRELVRRTRRSALDAYHHQDLPFEKLVDELNPKRDLSRHPLFQVMFALQNTPSHPLSLRGLDVSPYPVPTSSTPLDLELHVRVEAGIWIGSFTYNTDLFYEATIARMAGHYQILLENMLAEADQSVFEVPMLSATERRQLLVEWNETAADYSRDRCVHQLFEEQAAKTPEAVAVVSEDEQLTYRELNDRANVLAHKLRSFGVGPDVLVGICVDRSAALPIGLLGILKAGGAYMPIDPAYPGERIAFMMEDAAVSVLVTQPQWLSILPSHNAAVVILGDGLPSSATSNPTTQVNPENLLYVIYTSGSTGRPKGVAIEHRNTLALLCWAGETFSAEEISGTLASTSICFDLSVFEIFAPLAAGGKIILLRNILGLPGLAAAKQVTLINTVPSAMAELVRTSELPPSVLTVNLCGEALQTELVRQIYERGSAKRVYDLYGPSEDATYSTMALRRSEGIATIGRPIANKQVYILDSKQQPAPIGVPGELYLGGPGLARGYLNRPTLTADKFIPNPFREGAGERLYRTGDLCRYLSDGNIEFLGRIDDQVKLRGFRIELGEIEAVLMQRPEVNQCAVVAREDYPGDKRLVAYLAPTDLDTAPLRDFLKQKVPDYMIPAAFVTLPSLPQTPNGKIDRKALPVPENALASDKTVYPPQTELEQQLTRIWQDVLHQPAIGTRHDFFELGGHSLLAVRLIATINTDLDLQLPLATLFRAPTVETLAAAISNHQEIKPKAPHLIVPRTKGERPVIFWAPSIGSLERYVECHHLARRLEEHYYFYGFDPAPEFTDIPSLAQHCIRLMRGEQPHGPYSIAGYCQCGHIAYEIAQQLERTGEKVSLLAILDCSARDLAPSLRQRYHWLRDGFRGSPGAVIRRMRSAIRHRIRGTNSEAPPVRKTENPFFEHAVAALRHKAKPYRGRIALFRSQELSLKLPHTSKLGWDGLARAVDVHTVACGHSGMLSDPTAVHFIAKALESYLH